jgi:hypothetical protein
VVNADPSCDHRAVRSRSITLLLVAGALLPACAREAGRDFARYYDDRGLFVINLPAANDIVVTPPQTAQDGPDLLTGVVSSPPAPSPSPATGLGGFDLAATEQPDQTIYQAYAVTTDGFEDLDAMALLFLTGDPVIDVLIDDPIRIGGTEGKLVVADVRDGGDVIATLAAALTLGDGETGYLVAAIFPSGSWDEERADFERVLGSFHVGVPPGLATFPVSGQAS